LCGGLGSPIPCTGAPASANGLVILTGRFSNCSPDHPRHEDVGRPKCESAKNHREINPNVEVRLHNAASHDNALDILAQYDMWWRHGNFPTRYLTNDACVLLKSPTFMVHFPLRGQASVLRAFERPCYVVCIPSRPARHGAELRGRRRPGRLPGIIAAFSDGNFETRLGKQFADWRLLLFNALEMKFRNSASAAIRNARCARDRPLPKLIDYQHFAGSSGTAAPASNPDEVTVQEMKRALDDPKLGIKVIDVRGRTNIKSAYQRDPLFPLSVLPNASRNWTPTGACISLQERGAFHEG